MRCEELRRELDAEGQVASAAGRAHVGGCPECARAVATWEAARVGLRELRAEEPPPFLHARAMAGVRAARAAGRRRAGLPRWAWGAASVGAVLVGVALAGRALLELPAAPAPGVRPAAVAASVRDEEAAPAPEAPARDEAAPAAPPAAPPVAPPSRSRRERPSPVAEAAVAPSAAPAAEAAPEAPARVAAPAPEGDSLPSAPPQQEVRGALAGEPIAERSAAKTSPRPASVHGGALDPAAALGAALSQAAASPAVACLATRAGDPANRWALALPADLAPPPGGEVAFEVAADGTVALAPGAPQPAAAGERLGARLAAEGLPPGRYLLRRAD